MRLAALCTIIIVVAFSGGCARLMTGPQDDMTESSQGSPLRKAQDLQKQGNYAGALVGYRTVLAQHPATEIAAAAQYSIALVHVLPGNPEKDFAQALAEFDEFIRLFPQHKRAPEAQSWSQVLKTALDAKKENERLSKNIERLKQLDVKQEERRLGK